jgi:O-acetyl-ADP-ribose deacetylase (regulator of RNase III)
MSQIKIIHGSCADQQADAIVNAANRWLAAGGGICGVIFSKAGFELQNACDKYSTPLQDGDAVITPAFGLTNAMHIIHAVGPDFSYTPNAYDKLYAAYYNSLSVLKENGLHSISFPLISSGIFSGGISNPAAVSVGECVKAYNDFTKENKDYDITGLVCAYSNEQYIKAKEKFEEMI